ncbi:uncharacterized protein [Littorina saxatilis]|uniref:uncharacterized protein n=1 Tax=Littorina saxatilis TaxID=31220 RepID=UPI0038B62AAF
MASDSNRESHESLLQEIQRLEREKEELERKNKERQLLEQKLRELRGTVTSLKSGDAPVASTPIRENSSPSPRVNSASSGFHEDGFGEGRNDLGSVLHEGRENLQHLQDRLFGSASSSTPRSSGATRTPRVSRDKDVSAGSSGSDSEKGEDVMSEKHKHAIQDCRDILVENMLPDDIFNDLISRKILTTADVSRIKEKNTREAINEELLTILCRRSDRAFHVFVTSLRKTLQEYLANRIDPPTSAACKKKRKRQKGEVNIRLDCEEAEPVSPPRYSHRNVHGNARQRQQQRRQSDTEREASCTCREVEEQILRMAKEAYRGISQRGNTPTSAAQFRKEWQQTNTVVRDSMEIMDTLKMLCRHGDITSISEGSIIFTVRCHSAISAKELWDTYASGRLQAAVQDSLVTQAFMERCRVRNIRLKVGMSRNEHLRCLQELGGGEENGLRSATSSIKLQSKKRRKECENTRPTRFLHRRLRPHPRQAFQEMPCNQDQEVCLPSNPVSSDVTWCSASPVSSDVTWCSASPVSTSSSHRQSLVPKFGIKKINSTSSSSLQHLSSGHSMSESVGVSSSSSTLWERSRPAGLLGAKFSSKLQNVGVSYGVVSSSRTLPRKWKEGRELSYHLRCRPAVVYR